MKKKTNLFQALDAHYQKPVTQICQILAQKGYECYIVGGAVRDLLLNKKVTDIDFATNAFPQDVQKIFKKTIPTGIKHGTITILLDKNSFEITTYRSDGKYKDARHPTEIIFAKTLQEDLSRRDFTINALAYDPLTMELIDEYHGFLDIENKIIRAIGNPKERFHEDGLRTIRACRFAASLDFTIEKETYKALDNVNIQKRVAQISIERFTEEIWKGFRAQKVGQMIELLEKSGLLFLFTPYKEKYTDKTCSLQLEELYPASSTLRMAYWLYSLSFFTPQQINEWSKALRLSRKHTIDLSNYCRYFLFQEKTESHYDRSLQKNANTMQLYQTRKFLSLLKKQYNEKTILFLKSTEPYKKIKISSSELIKIYKKYPLIIKDLCIDGHQLKEMGLQGKEVGNALEKLLDKVLRKPEVNNRKFLTKMSKKRELYTELQQKKADR